MNAPVAAFFDLDRTLVRKNTAELFARYLFKHGRATFAEMAEGLWWVAQNTFNLVDMYEVTRKVLGRMAGEDEEETLRFCERWFDESVVPHVSQRALQRVEDHRLQGHEVAILSASSRYVAYPLARHLLIEETVCTELEVDAQGRFTGKAVEPLCYAEGKVHWARLWLGERGIRISDCYFYTDSYSDLPMLLAVGHPRVVNPDPQLKGWAQKHGWPIERF